VLQCFAVCCSVLQWAEQCDIYILLCISCNVLQFAAGVTQFAAGVTQFAAGVLQFAAHVLQFAAQVLQFAAHVLQCAAHVLQCAAQVLQCAAHVLQFAAQVLQCLPLEVFQEGPIQRCFKRGLYRGVSRGAYTHTFCFKRGLYTHFFEYQLWCVLHSLVLYVIDVALVLYACNEYANDMRTTYPIVVVYVVEDSLVLCM